MSKEQGIKNDEVLNSDPCSSFLVPCSIFSTFAVRTGTWCNGSTTDSDSVCLGSKPSVPTVSAKASVKADFLFSNRVKFLLETKV